MAFISEVEAIFIQRFYTGWISLRNQLITPVRTLGRRIIELYDALIAGNDWEVTPYLSLKRRAGHTLYVNINHPAQYLYSWKTNTMGTIPIIDTTGDVEYVNSMGTTTNISTKTGSSESSILGIGNYLYVGNPNFNFKWDGPTGSQGKTNWGISITNSASTYGPQTAGTGSSPSGSPAWTNPGGVTGSSTFATQAISNSNISTAGILYASNFSFSGLSIPATNSIIGVQVQLGAKAITAAGQTVSVVLTKGGTLAGTGHTFIPTGTLGTFSLGGSTDTWGTTLTVNDVNQTGFGVAIYVSSANASSITYSIQDVTIQLFTNSGVTGTPTGSGSFSAVNGFTYVIAYGNSASGEISNASPAGPSTGPFSSKAYVGVPVTASTDPQVNQIRVYRSTDSGGGNQFFEISNSPFPNTNATIQDTTPDTSLQVTSQAEINLGNTPPPAGLINLAWWSGRMWGSVNNLLYASTGPETISGTAPNSNWNPQFQYVIPQPILRLIPTPTGMIVETIDDCYIVRGTDITNYTINEFVKNLGIRSFNAVDTDGTNTFIFTSDRQFLQINASGIQDIGLPIGDQLLNVDPSQCYVAVNRYGLDSIVRILDTVNNVYYDFNLNQQCWNLPGILQMPSCTAMGSIETSPGVWRLLLCSTSGGTSKLAYRDISNFQDLGVSYAPNAVFGSIQLADPGTIAKFGALGGFVIQMTNAGTLPTLSVLLNDVGCTLSKPVGQQITGAFVSLSVGKNPIPWPPTLGMQPKNYRANGYYVMANQQRLSSFVTDLQFQLSAPAENQATELIGFGIFGDIKGETAGAGAAPQLQGR